MKTFAAYLAESERTYRYRIKICGDVPTEQIRELQSKLDQFSPEKIGTVKSTPIQRVPTDFPNFENEPVSMFDVSLRYPAIEPQIKQLAQLMGLDPNRVIMQDSDYADGMVAELDRIESENKDILTSEYPAPDAQQKALKKDYATGPYDHAVLKNAYRSDFTIAGDKTPAAQTTDQLPQGVKSPMTNIKRPPKPATGANPRG
jgi:hypothetical protein